MSIWSTAVDLLFLPPPLETSHHSSESFQELFWSYSWINTWHIEERDSSVSRRMFSHMLMFLLTACDLCSVGGQRGTNRFIMATHMKEGLPQQGWKQIWMNRTKVPLPLLEAANSLCCALWSGVMWTTKLCWETDQHKQPRPVCFTLHRHHFLLESICGQDYHGRGKKNQSHGKYYTLVRSLEGKGLRLMIGIIAGVC